MKSNEKTVFKSVAILGRQPALGIAELESLYGHESIKPFGGNSCLFDLGTDQIEFKRLGGSIRLARIIAELPTNWSGIESYLVKTTPEHAELIDGKLSFGLSVFGISVSPKQIARTALLIKKAIKATGHSVRMVPHDKTELGSATVLYNKLTAKNGWELLVVSDGKTTYLAQTTNIQDIDAYSERDHARPHRDAKVGMLPPKLAQILINLSVGVTYGVRSTKYDVGSNNSVLRTPYLILDPFCGTGVVLQEAMLMDYDIYGSDLEPRMVQYTIDNLNWLDTKYPDVGDYRRVEVGDATKHKWNLTSVSTEPLALDPEPMLLAVACETYLGQPLSALPPSDQLANIMHDVNALHHRFLQNISSQIKSGTRLCLAIPAWRGRHEFLHLSTLDYLDDLGYNRVKFEHVSDQDLIYHRENQVVGRELLVLERR